METKISNRRIGIFFAVLTVIVLLSAGFWILQRMQWSIRGNGLSCDKDLHVMASAIVIMVWYSLTALIFLSLFLAVPEYRGSGWLALMTVAWMAHTGAGKDEILLMLFPCLRGIGGAWVNMVSLPPVLICLMMALHASFPGALPKWLRRAVTGTAGVMAAAAVLIPGALYGGYLAILVMMGLAIVLFLSLFLRGRRPGQPQRIILAGLGLVLVVFVRDLIYGYTGSSLLPMPLMQPAFLIFSMLLLEAALLHAMQAVAETGEQRWRAEAEKEMLLEMNRLKGAFYTDMSHELKTPLTVIAANAQFAAQNIAAGVVDEETVVDLNAISAEARRLAQTVTTLVGIGRMQESEIESEDEEGRGITAGVIPPAREETEDEGDRDNSAGGG